MTSRTDRTAAVISINRPLERQVFELREDILAFASEMNHAELLEAIRVGNDYRMLFILGNSRWRKPETVLRVGSLRMRWDRLEEALGWDAMAKLTIPPSSSLGSISACRSFDLCDVPPPFRVTTGSVYAAGGHPYLIFGAIYATFP